MHKDDAFYDAVPFSSDALECADRKKPVDENIRGLAEKGFYHDAVLLLSYMLPKREAVWWASQCARSSVTTKTPARESTAINLAEAWAMKPDNDKRRKVLALGEDIGSYSAAGMVAMAAGWSAGNIAADDALDVPSPPHLSAVAVSAAVALAASADPDHLDENYKRFIGDGLNIISAPA